MLAVDCIGIRARDLDIAGQGKIERFRTTWKTSHARRGDGDAVIGKLARQNLGLRGSATQLHHSADELQRGFICLAAGVREHHVLEPGRRERRNFFREMDGGFGGRVEE